MANKSFKHIIVPILTTLLCLPPSYINAQDNEMQHRHGVAAAQQIAVDFYNGHRPESIAAIDRTQLILSECDPFVFKISNGNGFSLCPPTAV